MNAHSMSMHIGIFVNRDVARFDFSRTAAMFFYRGDYPMALGRRL